MERVAEYRLRVKEVIGAIAQTNPTHGDIETLTLCDLEHDQYQVVQVGWNGDSRVFAVLVYLHIHDGKIWIERDGTAYGVANQLLEAGIASDEIVLAFYPAWKRSYTDFASVA